MKHLTSLLFLAICLPAWAQPETGVSFRNAAGKTDVLIDGRMFTVLNHGNDWDKPFFYPMHASNGENVLRDIIKTHEEQGSSKEGTDHFHHKGVWVAVDSVNDEKLNFWHEKDRIVNKSVKRVIDGKVGRLELENHWLQGPKALVKETTSVSIHPSRLMVFRIKLEAVDKDVTIYDTKEGFLAVRVAHSMREMSGGHITNADGKEGEKKCWGLECPWVDYYGDVNGKVCGVTLMDHPDNFRKSRYHVRGYGLFAVSPFGPKKYSNNKQPEAPVTISPGGDPVELTYGVYIHDGDTKSADIGAAYESFLKAAK